jgi:3-deoxy-7-phosphoheptulonate synthase
LGKEGLEILRSVADQFDLLVITEALAVDHLPLVAEYADIVQIGSRNMQNFPLLWAAGESGRPVLLKRGFMSTISEWLGSVEHITSRGNEQIILCERVYPYLRNGYPQHARHQCHCPAQTNLSLPGDP